MHFNLNDVVPWDRRLDQSQVLPKYLKMYDSLSQGGYSCDEESGPREYWFSILLRTTTVCHDRPSLAESDD